MKKNNKKKKEKKVNHVDVSVGGFSPPQPINQKGSKFMISSYLN